MAHSKALETKALNADNKSEGMRMLFDQGYAVTEVRDLFDVPYGYAYGVAVRNGTVISEPRPAAKAKPAAKAAKPAAAKAKAPAKAAPRAKASTKTSARRRARAKA